MRPGTRLALLGLLLLLLAAAGYQLMLGSRDQDPYPGPVPGTPLPVVSATAGDAP